MDRLVTGLGVDEISDAHLFPWNPHLKSLVKCLVVQRQNEYLCCSVYIKISSFSKEKTAFFMAMDSYVQLRSSACTHCN